LGNLVRLYNGVKARRLDCSCRNIHVFLATILKLLLELFGQPEFQEFGLPPVLATKMAAVLETLATSGPDADSLLTKQVVYLAQAMDPSCR